jgi:cytochrome c oxidase assembly protein subunit 11
MLSESNQQIKRKNKRLLWKLAAGILVMFGFCYMLVPIYNLVCKEAGINGRSNFQDTANAASMIDQSRTITVTFLTTIHGNLPFKFKPLIHSITVHPGETKEVYFYAENESNLPLTVQAVPSIAPGLAAKYLKKTQCFCFTQQSFVKGERVDMPVIFHIDPEIPKNVAYLTLNYTLFDASQYLKKAPHFTKGRIDL